MSFPTGAGSGRWGRARARYDTFVKQLVADAQAAVDEVVALGVADPDRIAVAGHSYGAFMTANLLAHTDVFVTVQPRDQLA